MKSAAMRDKAKLVGGVGVLMYLIGILGYLGFGLLAAMFGLFEPRGEWCMNRAGFCVGVAAVGIAFWFVGGGIAHAIEECAQPASTVLPATENTQKHSGASPELLPTQLPKEKE